MPFVPVSNCYQAELRYLYHGQNVENVLYFEATGNGAESDMPALGSLLSSWLTTQMAPLLSRDWSVREIYITDLSTQTAPTLTVVPVTPIAGGIVSPAGMPGSIAFTVSFRTAGRGRSSRGRNYVMGLTEGDVSGNQVIQGWADSVVLAYQTLGSDAANAGMAHVVVSRQLNGVLRSQGLKQPVQAYVYTDLAVDSQRRRLTGRGT